MRWNGPLLATVGVMVPFLLLSLIGLAVDHRQLVDAPIWLKPMKFAVSILIFAVTWSWLLAYLPRSRKLNRAASGLSMALIVEQVLITGQVVRGRQSHYNALTPLDSVILAVMGTTIVALTVLTFVLTFALLRTRVGDLSVTRSLKAGAGISLAGMLVGLLMVAPRPVQIESAINSGGSGIFGAHNVGAPDGGEVLPISGWSAEFGDLRVPHFIGLHAIQVLPLLALFLLLAATAVPWLRDVQRRARIVLVGAGAYGGLVGISLWQALRGQSVAQPDKWTWLAIVMLAAFTFSALIGAVRPSRPKDAH